MVGRAHPMAGVMVAFVIGCAVPMVAGCAGVRSEGPKDEQGRIEATKEQTRSDRCEGTRTVDLQGRTYTTNDVSGCPKGGPLSGTGRRDKLDGEDDDDEIRGLGAADVIFGGLGSDVIYGGPGNDSLQGNTYWGLGDASSKDVLRGGPGKDYLTDYDGGDDVLYGGAGDDQMLVGGKGEDVIYGGDGNDFLDGATVDLVGHVVRKQRDDLYCGKGRDHYSADELDYVDSSCEVKAPPSNQ